MFFKHKIINYLKSNPSFEIRGERFYLDVEDLDIDIGLIFKQIHVVFKLSKEKKSFSLERKSKDFEEFSISLRKGEAYHGEQRLHFTFHNFTSIKSNIELLENFIKHAYESPEEIREKMRNTGSIC